MTPRLALVPVALAALLLSGCGTSTPRSTPADHDFVQHMLVHHTRALELGRLALERGADPRTRAFGQRILDEQTPERAHLQQWARTLHVTPTTDGATATGYVDDAEVTRLGTLQGTAFDRAVLRDSASSERGAVAMAATELADGRYAAARTLARSISGAPTSEIPQLEQLAAQLG